MPLGGLQHFTIEPQDLERSKNFYVNVLGLEVGDRPRNRRLRDAKPHGRLAHAAGLDDGHENSQVPQLHSALDSVA